MNFRIRGKTQSIKKERLWKKIKEERLRSRRTEEMTQQKKKDSGLELKLRLFQWVDKSKSFEAMLIKSLFHHALIDAIKNIDLSKNCYLISECGFNLPFDLVVLWYFWIQHDRLNESVCNSNGTLMISLPASKATILLR